MIKTITTSFLATTLVATSVFAQDDRGPGMPPPGERRGEWGQEIRGMRQEFREDRKEAVGEFKEGMKERRMWNALNASGTATGTKPTPWKNLREDMKDVREGAREDFREMRDKIKDEMKRMLPPRMASLTATQTAAIAGKLGITVDVLNAQLASGTKLKEIIKDKIKPEDMKQILPPRVASVTRAIQEQGFFNNFRSRLFGPREVEIHQSQNEFGEIEEVEKPIQGNGFFRRLFNW
jgi:hypothetical protein